MSKRKTPVTSDKKDVPPTVRLRYALLVLGMHRSGTSAVSGVLAKLGATPPRSPMITNEFNSRGYWESQKLAVLHDVVLQSAGSRWSDWGQFNQDWYDSPVFAEFEERLKAAITAEYQDSSFFLVKDPRISRILPLWLRALDKLEIAPKVIISVRHPEEVVQSLSRRDNFGRGKSLLLWLRHVLDVEFASRRLPRAFIRYEDLLEDWQSQMRRVGKLIGVNWPRNSAEIDVEINDFLSSGLRHHRVDEVRDVRSSQLDEWARRIYAAVSSLAQDGLQADGAFSVLDGIRQEFDRTAGIYAPVVREQESSAEKEYSQMKARLQAEIEQARKETEGAHAVATDMERRAVRAESDAKSRAVRLFGLQTDHDKLESVISEQAERYRQMETRLHANLGVLQAEIETRSEQLKSEQEALEKLNSKMATLRAERDDLTANLSERFHELAAFAQRMDEDRSKQAEMRSNLKRLQREQEDFAGVKHELESAQLELMKIRSELKLTQSDRSRLSAKLAAINKQAAHQKASFDAKRKATEQQIELLSSELQVVNERLGNILNSNTWKVSRPFRFIRRIMSGSAIKPNLVQADDIEKVRASGAFNEDWYLARYPDVAAHEIDPIYHYLAHGCSEGRDPAPDFNTSDYYKLHPEAVIGKHNALLHFLNHGGNQ